MKKLAFAFLFVVSLACAPPDPNSIVNDLCLIQITDNTERMQEFVAKTYTIRLGTSQASDSNGISLNSVRYTSISFTEFNASVVNLNLGRDYKVIIAPISTYGELVEIQKRLGKNFADYKIEKEPMASPTLLGENKEGVSQ